MINLGKRAGCCHCLVRGHVLEFLTGDAAGGFFNFWCHYFWVCCLFE